MALVEQATFRVVRRGALTAHEEQEVLSLCFQSWGPDFAVLWPTFADSTHILASLSGRVVSHALWVTRWVQPADLSPLRTAYVEAVITEAAYRGQGLATAVLRRLHAAIVDFELGALSPARHDFYQRLGWERWRGPLAVRTAAGLLATPGEELMILRLPGTPHLNLDAPISVEWREGELW